MGGTNIEESGERSSNTHRRERGRGKKMNEAGNSSIFTEPLKNKKTKRKWEQEVACFIFPCQFSWREMLQGTVIRPLRRQRTAAKIFLSEDKEWTRMARYLSSRSMCWSLMAEMWSRDSGFYALRAKMSSVTALNLQTTRTLTARDASLAELMIQHRRHLEFSDLNPQHVSVNGNKCIVNSEIELYPEKHLCKCAFLQIEQWCLRDNGSR